MTMTTNNEYLNEYIQTRGLSPKTYNSLKSVLKHYCKFQQSNLDDLLEEADLEEEAGVRWKKRKLKKRLTAYMNHLKATMDINSAVTYFIMIKTFYQHHEIEIGKLPAWNKRNAKVNNPITFNDLPDKEIIRTAVELSNPLMRCIILLLSSTGLSKVDMRKLTVQDFINSTFEYHHTTDPATAINKMLNLDADIIPVWRLRRSKTNKYFVTYNTPETTTEILSYLQLRLSKKPLNPTDKLLPISEHYFSIQFEKLNDAMGLGKVGAYNRFRGHMLRKFHASNLAKAGMERYKINVLQGKSNGQVDDVYFFEDENQLKKDYIKYMKGLLIFSEVVTVDAPEVAVMRQENQLLKDKLKEVERLKADVEDLKLWYTFD